MPIWARRKSKPNLGVGIDRRYPLSQGLVGCWPFNEGSGLPINAVDGQSAASNSMTWGSGPTGSLLTNTGTSKYVQVNAPNGSPLDVIGSGITFGGWVYPTVSNAYQLIIGKISGASRQYSLYLSASGTSQIFVTIGGISAFGGGLGVAVSPAWTVNAWNHVLVTYDGANVRIYINGTQANVTASTGSLFTVGGSLYMGYDAGSSNYGVNGSMDMPTVWNRALSGDEIRAFYANSWAVFESPRVPWLYRGSTIGGGSATLSAATGVFSFSGNAANLLAGRVLGAATGAYGLTGQAAALLSGRVLPAATGAFALTGIDAGLLAGRVLSASTGSYALTGNDAALLAGRVIAASTGVYVLTGNAANLVYTPSGAGAYVLVAETGTFALTGNDAGLLASRVLAAAPGSFAVAGSPASLTWSGHITPSFVDPDEITMITP